MRETTTTQPQLSQQKPPPELDSKPRGRELIASDKVLRELFTAEPELLDRLAADLLGKSQADRGRPGRLNVEQAFRVLVAKQRESCSYEELAFLLADSAGYRWFCGLGWGDSAPSSSALQRDLSRITPETMEAINRRLVSYAKGKAIEDGRKVRVDTTAVASNIHHPMDNSLLWDTVRVLVRIMTQQCLPRGSVFKDRTKRAKRLNYKIRNSKRQAQRVEPYRELVDLTRETLEEALAAAQLLERAGQSSDLAAAAELLHYAELGVRVVEQTERRVFGGEAVPAAEKIVSIFEPHTDVIRKDSRDTYYGHKVSLTTGASGLILDCVVEQGNPSDTTLAVTAIKRVTEILGHTPKQASFDGGYASRANLAEIKEFGVTDVAFAKKCGLEIDDMTSSAWIYESLRKFRAGIEGGISFLKRCFGLRRCTWSGFDGFRSYTWASVLAANLVTLARRAVQ